MGVQCERRSSKRYTIERQLQYRVRGVRPALTGAGVTINMSSSGVLFKAEQPLLVGKPIQVEINWPVPASRAGSLKFVARGRVVRSETRLAAMHIEGWEFRPAVAGAR